MPKITELDPGNLALRPTEVGVEATAAAARRGGTFFNQAAAAKQQTGHMLASGLVGVGEAAVAIEDHREISTGAAKGVELFSGLTQSKDEAIKAIDPNDPAYGSKVDAAMKQWREQQLEPALQKFSEGFNTQKSQAWAEHFIDQTRTHMWRESTADVASAAGLGVKNSVRTIVNEASNTATTNPSSVDALLDLVDHSVGGLVDSSPMKGVAGAAVRTEVTEKAREQIVKAGAVGAIAKSADPEATAADWIKRYPKYINGQEAQYLAQNARHQITAREADEHRKEIRAKQEAKEVSDEVADAYRVNVDSKDPRLQNDQTAQAALNDPRLLPKDRANVINYIKRQAKPETDSRISADTYLGLLRKITPDADHAALRQEAWEARLKDPGTPGSMSEADLDRFSRRLLDRKTPEGVELSNRKHEFMKSVEASIDKSNPLMGRIDHSGKQQLYAFSLAVDRKIDEYKKAGKDPHDLFDPGKPDFMGKPETLQGYQKSVAESILGIGMGSTAIPGAVKPATPIVVKNKEEAAKLPKGTQFIRENDPDKNVYTRK